MEDNTIEINEVYLYNKVYNLIVTQSDWVNMSNITTKSKLIDDIGFDNLDMIEFSIRLENEFDIEIPDEDMESLVSVQDVIDYIKK